MKLSLSPSLLEVRLPNADALDVYQSTVASQVAYDPGGAVIRGLLPAQYFHNGLEEELAEVIGDDRVHPGYSRTGALLDLRYEDGSLSAGAVTELAVTLQQKEGGDVSWYLSNRLKVANILLSSAVADGKRSVASEIPSGCPWPETILREAERRCPAFFYLGASVNVLRASAANLKNPNAATRQELSVTAGKLVLSLAQIADTLGTDYQSMLNQNIAKITKRIRDRTIFDKAGGDTR